MSPPESDPARGNNSLNSDPSTPEDSERERYDHASVEPKWQKYWDDNRSFVATRRPGRPKHYVLDMFPYPSGSGLHVGHPEGYTATDIMSRYWRMCGHDVLHPMGWDAFGLPAEQYAIKTGTHPATTTGKNIDTFRRQLKSLGFSYDWDREIATTDPEYVRWTQWIFLQLFKKDLAYQDKITVNWCPALGTVLANEEVKDGLSDRGNHPVERRPLRQWMLRITAYAERLEKELDGVDWPNGTLVMQNEWIGRSRGATIAFDVTLGTTPTKASDAHAATIEVFTTRPDTLMGATYVVLAPEHPLVATLTTDEQRHEVEAYVSEAKDRSDRDRLKGAAKKKTGVATGAFAKHPLTGLEIPVWVSDYVLWGYGTGAVMAVPAHDERDFAFAQTFALPMVEVVSPDGKVHAPLKQAFTAPGIAINSDGFDGLKTDDCKQAVIEALQERGKGEGKITTKLRDWVFSRQRYWGEPIPIYFPVTVQEGDPRKGGRYTIHHDQPIAVADEDLPLKLPDLVDFAPGDEPAGALARAVDWRFFQKDGEWFARETNTMPQWAGSCWYYLRFIDPKNSEAAWSQEAYDAWMPVDLYVGGAEHAVLHLLYARFWHKVLHDLGHVSDPEPFTKLVHQGMILGEDGTKMSKSVGNVVNPDDIVKAHGADVLRLYEMFMGPLEAVKPWQSSQIPGIVRFRDRLFAVATRERTDAIDDEMRRNVHRCIKVVTEDIERMSFNTAISAMMILVNQLMPLERVPTEAIESLLQVIGPFAPHMAEELWQRLGHSDSLVHHPWPTFDAALVASAKIEMGVQVNGKKRGTVELDKGADAEAARTAALRVANVAAQVDGKEIKKFIYVPGRIINFVVK